MKLDETDVMALPRKLVEQVILGLYDPINVYLVKLVGFDFSPELRQHFRRELRSWLRKIQRLRFKPHNRTGSSSIPSFYTTENIPLNDLHPDTVSAKRAMRGDSLCSGMVGINS